MHVAPTFYHPIERVLADNLDTFDVTPVRSK